MHILTINQNTFRTYHFSFLTLTVLQSNWKQIAITWRFKLKFSLQLSLNVLFIDNSEWWIAWLLLCSGHPVITKLWNENLRDLI